MDQMSGSLPPVYTYLLGMATIDEEFRGYLLADPQGAANSVGITLSDSQIEHLASLNPDDVESWLGEAEPVLGGSISAMAGW
ncbi:MAG TPA: Os1348 family NHLP clan protein [Anaerolineales bacterium]|jgi:hypothetical protein